MTATQNKDYEPPKKITGIYCPVCYAPTAAVVKQDSRFQILSCTNHPDIVHDTILGICKYITNNPK